MINTQNIWDTKLYLTRKEENEFVDFLIDTSKVGYGKRL